MEKLYWHLSDGDVVFKKGPWTLLEKMCIPPSKLDWTPSKYLLECSEMIFIFSIGKVSLLKKRRCSNPLQNSPRKQDMQSKPANCHFWVRNTNSMVKSSPGENKHTILKCSGTIYSFFPTPCETPFSHSFAIPKHLKIDCLSFFTYVFKKSLPRPKK